MSVTGDFAGGIRLGSHIVPTGTADTYPVTKPTFGLGGLRTVGSTADRDAIPTQRREEGMIVYVSDSNYYYGLCGGVDNDDWSLLSFGGTGAGGQGAKGNQGKTGPQGHTGPEGVQGRQGPSGNTGFQGLSGPIGNQGFQGPSGNTGFQGNFGSQGRQGLTGPRGLDGTGGTGSQGRQGYTGPRGFQGLIGVTGFAIAPAGPQGNQGFQGELGYQGPSGPTGERGSGKYTIGANAPSISGTGDKWFNTQIGLELTYLGLCGSWVATNAVIASGRTGTQGPIGNTGAAGAGDTGHQGPTGPQGNQGPSGNTGFQGLSGPEGRQGRQGPSGATGFQGYHGPQGRQGLTGGRGPQGYSGPTGPQGRQGYTGDQGVQGPIGVTGFAIAPAGPQGNQGFQGDRGYQGLSGPTGSQGRQGPTGPRGYQGLSGPTGPQGLSGPTGPQGVQGPQGLGIQFTTSSIQPTNSSAGDIWYDITTGIHFILNYDGNSFQWVQLDGVDGNQGPAGAPGQASDKGDTGNTGNTGNTGDGLFDTNYGSGTTLNHSLNFDNINTVVGDGRKFPVLLNDGSITFDYIRAQDIFLDEEFVFGINSFSISGSSTVLIGNGNYSLNSRTFSATYQEPGSISVSEAKVSTNATSDSGFPAILTSGSTSANGTNIAYPSSKNSSVTFTLGATGSDDSFVTSTDSITFRNNTYNGVTNGLSLTGGNLTSELTAVLDNNRQQTFTVNAGSGEYIYYAYPSSFGDATFKVGGFAGGFSKLHGGATAHTNADSFSETYFIYRSDNASLGSTEVEVT